MHRCTLLHARRSTHTAINMLIMPAITSTSSRMHGGFLRLLFLQAHRETTAHFTAIGMPAQQHCDSFRFRRAAFYNGLKSKVGLAAAKTAAMRIRTTHNAIIVLQVLMKSRALSAECLLGLQHSVLSALKCARFTVH